MKMPLIIMPAYNVENEISDLLDRMLEYRERLVIINDGSNDSTLDIITNKGFTVLNNSVNKGVSFSVNKGIKWAKSKGFDKIVLMDADGQHEPGFIPQFENALNFYDIVCGNRFKNNNYVPSAKLASNMMASLLVNSVWKCNIHDVACGFKAFCLNKGIEDAIDVSGHYSMVYDILFYSLHKKYKVGSVDINAIYYSDKLWYTRIDEILALFESIELFANMEKIRVLEIEDIKGKIYDRKSFHIEIAGFMFYAFFMKNVNGYIIQSDLKKLFNYANGDF